MQTFLAMFPRQASTHAAEVDHMTILVHWLMLVLFIGWGFFFLFVLFRFRSGANPRADYSGEGSFCSATRPRRPVPPACHGRGPACGR